MTPAQRRNFARRLEARAAAIRRERERLVALIEEAGRLDRYGASDMGIAESADALGRAAERLDYVREHRLVRA